VVYWGLGRGILEKRENATFSLQKSQFSFCPRPLSSLKAFSFPKNRYAAQKASKKLLKPPTMSWAFFESNLQKKGK
jgi:hypothetical protein